MRKMTAFVLMLSGCALPHARSRVISEASIDDACIESVENNWLCSSLDDVVAQDASAPDVVPSEVPMYGACVDGGQCSSGGACTTFFSRTVESCAPPCSTSEDCPAPPGVEGLRSACDQDASRCFLFCDGPGVCPPGLTCVRFGNRPNGFCS